MSTYRQACAEMEQTIARLNAQRDTARARLDNLAGATHIAADLIAALSRDKAELLMENIELRARLEG